MPHTYHVRGYFHCLGILFRRNELPCHLKMSKCFSVEQLVQCKERKVIETTHVLYVVVPCGVFYVSFVRGKKRKKRLRCSDSAEYKRWDSNFFSQGFLKYCITVLYKLSPGSLLRTLLWHLHFLFGFFCVFLLWSISEGDVFKILYFPPILDVHLNILLVCFISMRYLLHNILYSVCYCFGLLQY